MKSHRSQRLAFLDVARGGAAFLVLLEHGFQHCVPGYLEFSKSNIVVGQAAILVFFMISGFVIPMSLEEGGSNARFWLRRFFRLFPVYWFSIALAFAYLILGGPIPLEVPLSDTKTWFANLALLQGFLHRSNIWGVFWSMHYELGFYVVCSLLFTCGLLHRFGSRSMFAFLIGFAVFLPCAYLVMHKTPGNGDFRLVILATLFGMMAHRYKAGQMSPRTFYALLSVLVATVLFGWWTTHALFPESANGKQLLRWLAIMALAYGSFLFLLEWEARGRTLPTFGQWLGRRSYPIYLIHPFVIVLLIPTHWPVAVYMPSLIALTLLFADLTHRFVERPGIAIGRRLDWGRKTPPAMEQVRVQRAA